MSWAGTWVMPASCAAIARIAPSTTTLLEPPSGRASTLIGSSPQARKISSGSRSGEASRAAAMSDRSAWIVSLIASRLRRSPTASLRPRNVSSRSSSSGMSRKSLRSDMSIRSISIASASPSFTTTYGWPMRRCASFGLTCAGMATAATTPLDGWSASVRRSV